MNEHGLFSGGEVNILRWLTGAGIVATLGSMAILVYLLLRPSGKIPLAARWLMLVGILLLPAVSTVMGTTVGYSNVKLSCNECHTMDRWNEDMNTAGSEYLAARHWQNRWISDHACYTCHTGYGFSGNIEAKLGGLRHVWHELVTGPPPLDALKIHKPYDMKTCMHCHAEALSYLKVEVHVDPDLLARMKTGEMDCFSCHKPPHPRRKP